MAMRLTIKDGTAEWYNPNALMSWCAKDGGGALVRFRGDPADEEPIHVRETPEQVESAFNAAMRDGEMSEW